MGFTTGQNRAQQGKQENSPTALRAPTEPYGQRPPPPHPAASSASGRAACSPGRSPARRPAEVTQRQGAPSREQTARSDAAPQRAEPHSAPNTTRRPQHHRLPGPSGPSPSAGPAAARTRSSSTSGSAWPRKSRGSQMRPAARSRPIGPHPTCCAWKRRHEQHRSTQQGAAIPPSPWQLAPSAHVTPLPANPPASPSKPHPQPLCPAPAAVHRSDGGGLLCVLPSEPTNQPTPFRTNQPRSEPANPVPNPSLGPSRLHK